jgi:S1-C subfamily serine protease
MRFAVLLVSILVLCGPVAAQADTAAGWRAYENDDYRTAYKEWDAAARRGDAEAQYGLGLLFEFGLGLPQDFAKAVEWYSRAAARNQIDAQYALGYAYEYGRGVTRNYHEAAHWYKRAADAGDIDASIAMGYLHEHGLGVPQNDRQAAEYYRVASDQADPYGMYNYARLVADGRGTELNRPYAYALLGIVAGMAGAEEDIRNLAIEERARLRPKLTSAQISEADSIAASILGGGTGSAGIDNQGAARGAVSGSSSGGTATALPPATVYQPAVPYEQPSPGYYRGEEVRWVQQALTLLGYDAGSPDGALGPRTESAIREFQRDFGLPQDGQISLALIDAIETVLEQVAALPPDTDPAPPTQEGTTDSDEPRATGSGMLLNERGHVLTNNHVIEDCRGLTVRLPGAGTIDASPIATDPQNDLAVIRITDTFDAETFAAFREGRSVRLADEVIAVGYPLTGLLSSQVKVTTGSVNALAGLYDDSRHMQISVPVQPGNSGGPLVDLAGNVVGVITSKLDAIAVAEATGDIPQNINFAIKALVARSFLDANDIDYALAPSDTLLSAADAADRARRFTVLIACFD